MNYYYKILYASGSEKYIKTSSRKSEIWQKSPFGNRYLPTDKPYPIWEEPEYEVLTEKQFINAIANIDFEGQPRKIKAL